MDKIDYIKQTEIDDQADYDKYSENENTTVVIDVFIQNNKNIIIEVDSIHLDGNQADTFIDHPMWLLETQEGIDALTDAINTYDETYDEEEYYVPIENIDTFIANAITITNFIIQDTY